MDDCPTVTFPYSMVSLKVYVITNSKDLIGTYWFWYLDPKIYIGFTFSVKDNYDEVLGTNNFDSFINVIHYIYEVDKMMLHAGILHEAQNLFFD